MKRALLLLCIVFAGLICVAQTSDFASTIEGDTIDAPTFWLRPGYETGIAFFNNNFLKTRYNTKTLYTWGVFLRIGNPSENNVMPFVSYAKTEYSMIDAGKADSTIQFKEKALGINLILYSMNRKYFKMQLGFINAKIQDDVMQNNDEAYGIQMGLGFESIILSSSRVFINYSYDFIKLRKAAFRDYDMQKITFGFIL